MNETDTAKVDDGFTSQHPSPSTSSGNLMAARSP